MEGITYRKKNRLLLVAALLLLFTGYNFAIKRTMLVYNECSLAEEQILLAVNAPQMASRLEKELRTMEAKIGTKNLEEKNPGEALLELLTNYCQESHSVLREFPETIITDQEKLLVETNLFIVEGDFPALITLVYTLEQKAKLGKIASVHYQLKKDSKTKSLVLTATVYLQNVKKKENEK